MIFNALQNSISLTTKNCFFHLKKCFFHIEVKLQKDKFGKSRKLKTLLIISYILHKVNFFISFYVCYILIKDSKSVKKIHLFLPMLVFSFLDNLIIVIIFDILRNEKLQDSISEIYQPLYIILEIVTVFIFYQFGKSSRNIIKDRTNLILIVVLLILFVLDLTKIISFYLILVIFEFLMINTFAIKLFYSEIDNPNFSRPKSDSIINNGLFAFINFTVPFYIISDNGIFFEDEIKYTVAFINEIGYMIIFLSLIKSVKWKTLN